jgi:predicted  nucleic acid-binding Zn-ribbon protein
MVTSIQQAKNRLNLSAGIGPGETKLMLKDLYTEIETLQKQVEALTNEIRKISENRSRSNKDTGRNI